MVQFYFSPWAKEEQIYMLYTEDLLCLCELCSNSRFLICLQVLQESNVRREVLKARAMALKHLGKIFQVQ